MGKFSIQIFTYILIVVFLSHFVGDFVLQSDKMSKEKSKSLKVLNLHCLILTNSILIGLLVFVFAPMVLFGYPNKLNLFLVILAYSIVNGGLHFLVDYFTSKKTAKLWAEGRVHDFFVVIGLDQFIHIFFYTAIFAVIRTL